MSDLISLSPDLLQEGEHIDTLKQNGYKIIQNSKGFCFGIDAVLLANYVNLGKAKLVYDLGTGTGIIPLLLSSKTESAKFVALEVQEYSANMAKRSVELNQLSEKINIINTDIKAVSEEFPKAQADIVISNPPYMINEHGKQNPNDYKKIARHEILCTLDHVVKAAAHLLKVGGDFYMIHRPFRLSEIFVCMSKYGLEPKKMRLIQPSINKEANMVLIQARKGARPRITIETPLIVYESKGVYTKEIQEIYKS